MPHKHTLRPWRRAVRRRRRGRAKTRWARKAHDRVTRMRALKKAYSQVTQIKAVIGQLDDTEDPPDHEELANMYWNTIEKILMILELCWKESTVLIELESTESSDTNS